ncbi:response regulator transcription factor [Chitinophaga pollutisoli]|uniref:Response regulator transcription factor n=1 Tax=Chitinophaga pollutisoli TaxID=3133966 RepID=A0ABZ2YI15_9BACT
MNALDILIADDHPIFLKGLREVIESGGNYRVIYQAANGREAVEGVRSKHPDVVILDIDMPQLNGLQAAEEILLTKPEMPIILLTMHKVKDAFMKALEIGILGYVLKENAVVDIIHAIQSVTEGNAYISPEMSTYLLRQKHKTATGAGDMLATLTPSEFRIIHLVAAYKTSKEIAEELHISEKTVSNHRMNITRKLSLSGKNSLLRFAIEATGGSKTGF